MLRTMRNLSESSARIGRTFCATGLYFFFCAAKMLSYGWMCGSSEVEEVSDNVAVSEAEVSWVGVDLLEGGGEACTKVSEGGTEA